MRVINNEMTFKYSWKSYQTGLWFPVGCVEIDKSYTTVDFQKDFVVIIGIELKNVKSFLVSMFFLESNQAVVL